MLLSLMLLGRQLPAQTPPRVLEDIAALAHDSMAGRRADESRAHDAAVFITRRLTALNVHVIEARSGIENVVGLIPGSDSTLRAQYIVVGAHYDHLGHSPHGALDPEAKDAVRNGADDNASGVAAIMELAHSLSLRPTRRSIAIVAFTGEEPGLLGSRWFVTHPPVPLDSIVAMMNFDMVGRLGTGELLVRGVRTSRDFPFIVQRANADTLVRLRTILDADGPSDHQPFIEHGIPSLHFFTGLHSDYHRATDDVEKIDIDGELRVIAVAVRVIRAIADAPVRLPSARLP